MCATVCATATLLGGESKNAGKQPGSGPGQRASLAEYAIASSNASCGCSLPSRHQTRLVVVAFSSAARCIHVHFSSAASDSLASILFLLVFKPYIIQLYCNSCFEKSICKKLFTHKVHIKRRCSHINKVQPLLYITKEEFVCSSYPHQKEFLQTLDLGVRHCPCTLHVGKTTRDRSQSSYFVKKGQDTAQVAQGCTCGKTPSLRSWTASSSLTHSNSMAMGFIHGKPKPCTLSCAKVCGE